MKHENRPVDMKHATNTNTNTTAAKPEKAAYLARDTIMKLLSDEETARVSAAEGNNDLVQGDMYVDLQHLGKGVQRASGPTKQGGDLVPQKAVRDQTWQQIQAHVRDYVG